MGLATPLSRARPERPRYHRSQARTSRYHRSHQRGQVAPAPQHARGSPARLRASRRREARRIATFAAFAMTLGGPISKSWRVTPILAGSTLQDLGRAREPRRTKVILWSQNAARWPLISYIARRPPPYERIIHIAGSPCCASCGTASGVGVGAPRTSHAAVGVARRCRAHPGRWVARRPPAPAQAAARRPVLARHATHATPRARHVPAHLPCPRAFPFPRARPCRVALPTRRAPPIPPRVDATIRLLYREWQLNGCYWR